jgi:hypothetical protein
MPQRAALTRTTNRTRTVGLCPSLIAQQLTSCLILSPRAESEDSEWEFIKSCFRAYDALFKHCEDVR